MKTTVYLLSLLTIGIMISCSKTDQISRDPQVDPPVVPDSIGNFKVEVIQRSPRNTIIRWTEVKSTNAADTVKYRVTLDGVMIDSNLTRLTDTLRTVVYGASYTGTVTAYTSRGLSLTQPFTLKRYSGVLVSASPYTVPYGTFMVSEAFSDNSSVPVYWTRNFEMSGSTPTISNDTLFFHCALAPDPVTRLRAINLRTGNEYWNAPTPQIHLADNSSMTYSRGYLYASTDSGLICFNSRNGARIWKNLRGTPNAPDYYTTNPIVDGNKVFVVTRGNSGTLAAIDINTGTTIWEFYLARQAAPTPVVSGELIIVVAGEDVVAFNKNTGAVVWQKNRIAYLFSSPILTAKNIIIPGGLNNIGFMTALDPATGATLWSKQYNGASFSYTSSATGAGLLYLTADTSIGNNRFAKMIAADINTGNIAWQNVTYLASIRNLIYADNSLYIGGLGVYQNALKISALSGNPESGLGVYTQTFAIEVNGKSYYNVENGNYKPDF